PMGAAIWSCPPGRFREFPIEFILQFYRHHGLMQLRDRPQWYTIPGGSQKYVQALTAPFSDRICLNAPVQRVERGPDGVRLMTDTHDEVFDEVIFACHSDQALAMLADPTVAERAALSAFPYESNHVVLHYDERLLPRRRKAWAAWNYQISPDPLRRPIVTYSMNLLQHLKSRHQFCVTLNETDGIDEARVISRHNYSHPVFTLRRASVQKRHVEFIRRARTSYCGAWWGNGFHEDGVASAVRVCDAFGPHRLSSEASMLTQQQRSGDQAPPLTVGSSLHA
ncbi:MAG: FAD-dependent oxidoreductase, partial [Planctomycetaceae bacterium]|nr:FAD-dependent oxidoreductase [Planctomycetaceae bacterium]